MKKHQETSLLLLGNSREQMMEDALKQASFLLDTDVSALSAHPDFLPVSLKEGEKTIGTEEAEMIVARSMTLPVSAKKTVVLIDGMEKMTVQAQNKLLKLLEEEGTIVVIAVACEDTLLPTVKSRMRIVPYRQVSFSQYVKHFDRTGKDPEVWYYATGGIVGKTADEDVEETFLKVKRAFTKKDAPGIFQAFHAAKEKDTDAFFLVHRAYVPSALSFLGALVMGNAEKDPSGAKYMSLLDTLANHRGRCHELSYTKDSFFSCLAEIAEAICLTEEGGKTNVVI